MIATTADPLLYLDARSQQSQATRTNRYNVVTALSLLRVLSRFDVTQALLNVVLGLQLYDSLRLRESRFCNDARAAATGGTAITAESYTA